MNAPALNHRLDYLDAVRAFALLLGIVFHASMSFVPIFIGWAVMDLSTRSSVLSFLLVSHSFRMELFFLIAGFFSHMTFHRKGGRAFIRTRFLRVAVPFIVGWFLLKPLIISAWVMGAESMRGDANLWNGLKIGFQSLGQLPKDLFVGSHLWFLYYLLLVTAIALVVRTVIHLNSNLYAKVTHWTDRMVTWVVDTRFSWLVLSLPTAACLWYMRNWGMDTPDKSLVPQVSVILVYGGFFTFGWLLHRQPELMGSFARLSFGRFALGIIGIGGSLILSAYQTNLGHPQIGLIRGGFVLSYAFMMWSLVGLIIGLFKRFLDKPSKVVRYVADSSYWLYLVHLPIVVLLQIAFAELPLHWSLKLIAISLLTVGISLVLYDLFVRSTFIGKTLNGQKKERALFLWGSKGEMLTQSNISKAAKESAR